MGVLGVALAVIGVVLVVSGLGAFAGVPLLFAGAAVALFGVYRGQERPAA